MEKKRIIATARQLPQCHHKYVNSETFKIVWSEKPKGNTPFSVILWYHFIIIWHHTPWKESEVTDLWCHVVVTSLYHQMSIVLSLNFKISIGFLSCNRNNKYLKPQWVIGSISATTYSILENEGIFTVKFSE